MTYRQRLVGGQDPDGTCLAVTYVRQFHLTAIFLDICPSNVVDGHRTSNKRRLVGGQGSEGTCLAVTHVRQFHLTAIFLEM